MTPLSPQRIQLRRTKGWRKPGGAIVVARPSKWGNPFRVADCIEAGFAFTEEHAHEVCVGAFRDWLNGNRWADGSGEKAEQRHAAYLASLPELRGHDLACWCAPGRACHADVLLDLVNSRSFAPASPPYGGRPPLTADLFASSSPVGGDRVTNNQEAE